MTKVRGVTGTILFNHKRGEVMLTNKEKTKQELDKIEDSICILFKGELFSTVQISNTIVIMEGILEIYILPEIRKALHTRICIRLARG